MISPDNSGESQFVCSLKTLSSRSARNTRRTRTRTRTHNYITTTNASLTDTSHTTTTTTTTTIIIIANNVSCAYINNHHPHGLPRLADQNPNPPSPAYQYTDTLPPPPHCWSPRTNQDHAPSVAAAVLAPHSPFARLHTLRWQPIHFHPTGPALPPSSAPAREGETLSPARRSAGRIAHRMGSGAFDA